MPQPIVPNRLSRPLIFKPGRSSGRQMSRTSFGLFEPEQQIEQLLVGKLNLMHHRYLLVKVHCWLTVAIP